MKDDAGLLAHWFKGDQDAIGLAFQLAAITHMWDDLIDRDKGIPDRETINESMWYALIGVRRNPFFRRHEVELDLLLEIAIDTWHEANDLERDQELLLVAYSIRSVLTPIIIRMAYLIGGRQWGREAAKAIRLSVYDQPFRQFVQEVCHGVAQETIQD